MQSQQWHPIAGSSDSLHWSPRMLESGEQTRPYRVVERICSQWAPRKCWVFLLWAYQLEKQVWIDSENLSGETLRERSINKPNLANQKVSINITAPRKSKGCFGNTREFLSPTQSSFLSSDHQESPLPVDLTWRWTQHRTIPSISQKLSFSSGTILSPPGSCFSDCILATGILYSILHPFCF